MWLALFVLIVLAPAAGPARAQSVPDSAAVSPGEEETRRVDASSDDSAGDAVGALLAQGDALYAQFQNGEARDVFLRAYERASESFDVLLRLARTTSDLAMDLEADGEAGAAEHLYEEAVGYAESLLRLFPDSAQTYFQLIKAKGKLALFRGGREKVQTGQNVEAYCLRGLELDSTNADLHASYGVFQREVADLSWIERTFAQALFGSIPRGTKERAVHHLQQAIALRPDFAFAHYELGVTLMAMGAYDEASDAFQRSLDLPARTTQDIRNRVVARRMLDRLP